jgi:hypothetical protein
VCVREIEKREREGRRGYLHAGVNKILKTGLGIVTCISLRPLRRSIRSKDVLPAAYPSTLGGCAETAVETRVAVAAKAEDGEEDEEVMAVSVLPHLLELYRTISRSPITGISDGWPVWTSPLPPAVGLFSVFSSFFLLFLSESELEPELESE